MFETLDPSSRDVVLYLVLVNCLMYCFGKVLRCSVSILCFGLPRGIVYVLFRDSVLMYYSEIFRRRSSIYNFGMLF